MRVMVAPNGARLTQRDHPAVPVTIRETIACAAACFAAGADAIHAHVRDDRGVHSLDIGRYRELLDGLRDAVPAMSAQITTELGGRYAPQTQRRIIRELAPRLASVALREQMSDADHAAARTMYFEAQERGTQIQHILYSPEEAALLEQLQDTGVIPLGKPNVLFVLGRYEAGQPSTPEAIDRFLSSASRPMHWMVAAFGSSETACLVAAAKRGGTVHVGFENNRMNADGTLAASNAVRVTRVRAAIECNDPILCPQAECVSRDEIPRALR